MTVPSGVIRNSYTGNGVSDEFEFDFKIQDEEEVLVSIADADGTDVSEDYELNTDFTVTIYSDDTGGKVVFSSPLTDQYTLVLTPNVPLTQQQEISNQGGFFPSVLENALDKLTLICKQLQEQIDRCVKINILSGDTATDYLTEIQEALDGAETAETNAEAAEALAEEWATKTGSAVAASEWSAKEHAVGTSVTSGSAKDWASKTSSTVVTSEYSAKEWARGTQTRGASGGGSAKDWANYTGGTVDNSEYSAKKYATDAATSASNASDSAAVAQAIADGMGFQDTEFKAFADSPITVSASDTGKMFAVDTSGGNVVINLPTIASLTLPFLWGFKKTTGDGNTVTINCGGTDTFDNGETSKVIGSVSGSALRPDTDNSPDEWVAADFGAVTGQQKKEVFTDGADYTSGSSTTITITETPLPGSKDSLTISFDGVEQFETEWEYDSGTGVVTFDSAIPLNTDAIQAVWATPLSIGTPADGSVTLDKIDSGTLDSIIAMVTQTPACRVTTAGAKTISPNAATKVTFDTETWDTGGCYDNATNYRFTPDEAGKYRVTIKGAMNSLSTTAVLTLSIYKNGSSYSSIQARNFSSGSAAVHGIVTDVVSCNGTTDYIEGYVTQSDTGNNRDLSSGAVMTIERIIGA